MVFLINVSFGSFYNDSNTLGPDFVSDFSNQIFGSAPDCAWGCGSPSSAGLICRSMGLIFFHNAGGTFACCSGLSISPSNNSLPSSSCAVRCFFGLATMTISPESSLRTMVLTESPSFVTVMVASSATSAATGGHGSQWSHRCHGPRRATGLGRLAQRFLNLFAGLFHAALDFGVHHLFVNHLLVHIRDGERHLR